VESGVDPSLFSQALMYHAHRYSRSAWAGEPEIDPTLDYEEREQIEGWEMTPYECLDLAYGGVLRERLVQAGKKILAIICIVLTLWKVRALRVLSISTHHQAYSVRPSELSPTAYSQCFPLTPSSLGDSGFSIIRSSSVFYRQAIQTHFFNCPKWDYCCPFRIPPAYL
jgi:protein phosphatase PTC7